MQTEYSGTGSVNAIRKILKKEKPKSVFLVTGKFSYEKTGIRSKIQPLVSHCKITHFADFSVNPSIGDIKKGIALFRKSKCDFVIAAGGGSVIDIAKAINIFSPQKLTPEKYLQKKLPIERKGKKLLAIPTTAGTGSEATHFAVVYIGKEKYSISHQRFLLPEYVILDPALSFSLPPHITACTGMDALAQAIESYWSVHSTGESKKYSRKAIRLVLDNLRTAVMSPTQKAKAAMMRAANNSGKAINIAYTTACHSISYPLTSYFGVPHGHAVALTLGEMFLFNTAVRKEDCLDARGEKYVSKTMKELARLFGENSPEGVCEKLKSTMDSINLERRLVQVGVITEQDIHIIIKNGFNQDRIKNNPRRLTETSLRQILRNIK